MFNIALIQPQSFELDNGLQLTLAGDFSRSRPYCAIVFLAKCGLYTETDENNGITHALEHILFKGSRKYSNYDITSIINSRGGSIDAFTTSDSLGIEIIIPPRHLGDALEVLSQLALNPAFPENEIELEKKVIIEEMRFYRDDPEDLVMLKLEKACYKDSCYSREILGTKKSVSGLTKKHLTDYHRDYFTPSNCTLTIAGSFDAQTAFSCVERNFGPDAWPAASSPAKNTDYMLAQNSDESFFIRRRGKFTQNYYAIGFTTPSSLENKHIYSMFLPYVFSSLKSSPLLYSLKDEHNAVNGMTTDLVFKYGMWMITVLASYSPARSGAVKSAIGNFIANASRFVSENYFESIKKCFLLDYMQEIENPRTYCGELSTFNHILGAGSYNYVVKTLLELEYENFIEYLRAHVETSHYKRVELVSAPAKKREIKARPVTPLIERINDFNCSHTPAAGDCERRFILKKRPRNSRQAPEIIKIDERSTICSIADPEADYSTLSLFIKGGVSSSFKPGDANMLAELFGRKTAGSSMYENYMLSDSRGIYFDCNSFLDYFKFEAVTAGEWSAEKVAYLDSLFEGFHFNGSMLKKAAASVKNMIKAIRDDVFELSFWGFLTSLFERTAYGKAVFANAKALKNIGGDDILKYYSQVRRSPFISFAVSSPSGGAGLISGGFKSLIKRAAPQNARAEFSGGFEAPVFEREIKSSQAQCTIVAGSAAPSFTSPDGAAFSAANYILSDYAGKRLWNIREKHGLCYNIFSEYIPLGLGGAFFCYANTSAEKLELTSAKIAEELERFAQEGPSASELAAAKTQLIKRFENSASFSSAASRLLGQYVFYENNGRGYFDYTGAVKSLTPKIVAEIFRKYCPPGRLSRLKILAG